MSQSTYTSLTMNFNIFENLPTAGTPSGFSNAMKVCPGVSYGRDLIGLDKTSANSSAFEESTMTVDIKIMDSWYFECLT